MAWVKIVDNVVTQKQPYQEDGFEEVSDNVVCGQIKQSDGSFANPTPPELTYAEKREREYPSIPDQLDMQYHDTVNSTTTWKDAIKTVKDKYPKDGE
jgi:hypothetical protein